MSTPGTSSPAEISRASMAVAALSTVVEWYDFTLYLYFATVLSRVFFGGSSHSLLATLAGFAVSYAMRPLGAMVFGHIGDRLGRQRTLLLSMMLMTLAMLATALLPDYAAIGPTAGGLLLVLWNLRAVWSGNRRWPARLWSLVLAFSALVMLWIAIAFHLISWGVNY